jgi:putative flippase GtrA
VAIGSDDDATARPTSGRSTARHLAGFIISGLLAFAVDAAVLAAGVVLLGLDPRLARPVAIAAAMVVAWLAHRRLTFAVANPPTASEFVRYAAAAWMAAALNYAVFAALLSIRPDLPTAAALLASTGVATFLSYASMRWVVFRDRS